MAIDPLLRRLRQLELPPTDYAVFGSGPLLVRGVIQSANDLDVLCRGAAWAKALTLGPLVRLEPYGVDLVHIDEGAITLGTTWGIGEFDVDELIQSAEIIEGIPFVLLEHVVSYKKTAGRPKDLEHLALLDQWSDRQR